MLRNVFLALIALVIAVGGGTMSAWYAVNRFDGFGALTIGRWTAHPEAGTPLSDPYAKARAAREGAFPLGSTEGLAFYAYSDGQGKTLDRRCSYKVEGNSPNSRFWTLYAADRTLVALDPGKTAFRRFIPARSSASRTGNLLSMSLPKRNRATGWPSRARGRMVARHDALRHPCWRQFRSRRYEFPVCHEDWLRWLRSSAPCSLVLLALV